MERVIDCPCGKDKDSCFEEVQENFSSFMCFACGFMSDTRFEKDSLHYQYGSVRYDISRGKSKKLELEIRKSG